MALRAPSVVVVSSEWLLDEYMSVWSMLLRGVPVSLESDSTLLTELAFLSRPLGSSMAGGSEVVCGNAGRIGVGAALDPGLRANPFSAPLSMPGSGEAGNLKLDGGKGDDCAPFPGVTLLCKGLGDLYIEPPFIKAAESGVTIVGELAKPSSWGGETAVDNGEGKGLLLREPGLRSIGHSDDTKCKRYSPPGHGERGDVAGLICTLVLRVSLKPGLAGFRWMELGLPFLPVSVVSLPNETMETERLCEALLAAALLTADLRSALPFSRTFKDWTWRWP